MTDSTHAFRPEIQGLRAVAVLVVLVFHVWPHALPGGYVGVDVFFVISGFLITDLLLREAEARGTISLRAFYARRIKRLLPAATCALLAAAAATALLPEDRRGETGFEIAASALYSQNLWLARRARDYLASDEAPSILQHFWSLSVEEQYYIVWPLLLLLAIGASARRARPRAVFAVLVTAVFALSLAHSVRATAIEAGTAYFSTSTRAWELALGGALAVFPGWRSLPNGVRAVAGLIGLLAIGIASRTYGARTAFPGYAALLPTLGAALVLISGSGGRRFSADALLESRPAQYFGDVSYSLYLWHWLVVSVFSARIDRALGLADGMLVAALAVALAHLSKRYVEDPFRRPGFASATPWRPFAFASACIAASLLTAGVVHAIDASRDDENARDASRVAGARALEHAGYDWRREDLATVVPSPRRAISDLPAAYAAGCMQQFRGSSVKKCAFGAKKSKRSIVLIGDSHAAHWFPALEQLADEKRIRAYGVAKSACAFSLDAVYDGIANRPYAECLTWSRRVLEWLRKERPDLVLVAQSPMHRPGTPHEGSDADAVAVVGQGMAKAWAAVGRLGLKLASFETTPWSTYGKVSDCLSRSRDWRRECALPRDRVFRPDPVDVAARLTRTPRVDLNDALCIGDTCPPMIGGVLVYRDAHHLTATYSRTLAPRLEKALIELELWPR